MSGNKNVWLLGAFALPKLRNASQGVLLLLDYKDGTTPRGSCEHCHSCFFFSLKSFKVMHGDELLLSASHSGSVQPTEENTCDTLLTENKTWSKQRAATQDISVSIKAAAGIEKTL